MAFKDSIFKAYDIRGLYPREFDAHFAYALGWAFIEYLHQGIQTKPVTVVVGQDVRQSSEILRKELVRGLISHPNVKAHDLGLVTGPLLFYTANDLNADGSVMVGASHNPEPYAGFKLTGPKGKPITNISGLQDLRLLVGKVAVKKGVLSPEPNPSERELLVDRYFTFLRQYEPTTPVMGKVVVDAGNGSVGPLLSMLTSKHMFNFIPLHWEPDGSFPNRPPNPLDEKGLAVLAKKVKANKAEFGCAFDDDGDRIIFIDQEGQAVAPDFILALLAEQAFEEGKGAVVAPVNMSRIVKEVVLDRGGQVARSRVGWSFMTNRMQTMRALVGGEISGHYYYREFFGGNSGLLTLFKVLNIYQHRRVPFSELVAPYQKYFKTQEINFEGVHWLTLLPALRARYAGGQLDELDGLTVEYENWWFNIRPSNTEPVVRLVVEAETQELLKEKVAELEKQIRAV